MAQDDGVQALALIDDDALFDEVLRLAAAAGCDVRRTFDVAEARARWLGAPLVVLDERHARECHRAGLPRRDGVLLVSESNSGEAPARVWQRAVSVGAVAVVCLPAGETDLVAAFSDALERPSSTIGSLITVIGGRGGAGASVLAAAVGLTVLRNGGSALLVDCDPAGGGLDLLLGVEADSGLRWPDLRVSSGRVPALSLHSALPGRAQGDGRLAVVSCDRDGAGPTGEAVAAVVESGRRAGDVVVCDLPRELDGAGGSAWAAVDRADHNILVVPAEVRACASAKRIAARFRERAVPFGLVVRGPAPGGLTTDEVSAAVGAPLIGYLEPEPRLARQLEHGRFVMRRRGPLEQVAAKILAVASAQRADDAETARAA